MKRKAQKGMVHMDKGAESKGKEALKGRVHIYWGDGKGKTTAALGLALRAAGRGKQVVIARFLKTEDSGEVFLLRQVPGIRLLPCAKSFGFTFQMDEKIRQEAALFYGGLFSQAVREAKGADLLILDEILRQLDRRKGEFASVAGNYTASVVNRNLSFIMDTGLEDKQKQNTDKIFSYQKDLLDKEMALKDLEEPEVPQEISKKKVAVQGVKFALIGSVGGAFLLAFYFCMIYVLSGKLHTDDELKDRFRVKILGVFALPVKTGVLCGIDRWLERLEGKAARPSEEAVLKRVALNIQNYVGEAKKLLLTGTVSEDILKDLAGKLSESLPGIQLVAGADMNKAADTLRLLAECDGVILVEKREASKCAQIQKEKESIDALKKPIIGCMVL